MSVEKQIQKHFDDLKAKLSNLRFRCMKNKKPGSLSKIHFKKKYLNFFFNFFIYLFKSDSITEKKRKNKTAKTTQNKSHTQKKQHLEKKLPSINYK